MRYVFLSVRVFKMGKSLVVCCAVRPFFASLLDGGGPRARMRLFWFVWSCCCFVSMAPRTISSHSVSGKHDGARGRFVIVCVPQSFWIISHGGASPRVSTSTKKKSAAAAAAIHRAPPRHSDITHMESRTPPSSSSSSSLSSIIRPFAPLLYAVGCLKRSARACRLRSTIHTHQIDRRRKSV